ncbi:MAG TPA: histidinol-phosphate transaminase [Acidimicrobiia bacterium]
MAAAPGAGDTSDGEGGRLPQPRDDLRELEGYHSPQLDVHVRLNTNESPYAPPVEFVDRWLGAVRDAELHRYPDRGAVSLRAAIAKQLDQPADRVFCANGSNEVLQTILLTYGGPGRNALIFEPTYALHSHIARITSTGVLDHERGDDFHIDVDAAVARVRAERPAVVFVCSPNNPTGTVEPQSTVRALVDAVAEHRGLLVVDEAYGEFADNTAIDLISDARPLVVVRTYSKVWSLAATRLGFCVAPPAIVAELEKVVLPYHLSVATQLAGTVALDFRDAMLERVAGLVEERGRVFAQLAARGDVEVFPSGANFILMRPHADSHTVWSALVERGVLVRDFSRWPRVEGCLRVTIGTPDENRAFLEALDGVLADMRGGS